MSMKNVIHIIFICFLLIGSTLFLTGCLSKRESILVDSLERYYTIHVPESYDALTPVPLVLVFHGGGGNPDNIARTTGMNVKADTEGFIVVYPDGTGRFKNRIHTWNVGFCCGYSLENNIDDVLFIDTLVQHLKNQYTIDENRIYATGMSNGGMMTYRVGAELSNVFAAIAPVAAQIGGQATEEEILWRIPQPDYPVSVIAFNGMNDSRVPYDGGRPADNDTHVYSWISTNESIQFWVEHNHCNIIPSQNTTAEGNVIIETYTNGTNNTEVVLCTIVDGTHSWPGGQKGHKKGAEPTMDVNATDMMWEFFINHPKQR